MIKPEKIVKDTSIILTLDDEKVFSKFLQRILELYLKNEFHANAGTVYNLINTDKSFKIYYCNSGDCRNTNYREVRKLFIGNYPRIRKK